MMKVGLIIYVKYVLQVLLLFLLFCNKSGFVANFVETEQILENNGVLMHKISFII
jgi:hypothetical protein